jgi:hypothetical protein
VTRTAGVAVCDHELRLMDPNTHAYVLATAFITSLLFALGAWLPVALMLRQILLGH